MQTTLTKSFLSLFSKACISQFKLKGTSRSGVSMRARGGLSHSAINPGLGRCGDTQREPHPITRLLRIKHRVTRLLHNPVFFSHFPIYYSQQPSISSIESHVVLCLPRYVKTQVLSFSIWKLSSVVTSSTTFITSLLNIPIILWP